MPALEKHIIESIRKDSQIDYEVFIESGSFMGETILSMESLFTNLHTVEIKKEFYERLIGLYKGNKINFHLGESFEIFDVILPEINKNAIFFLDGHWSAGNTAKGKKDVPIYEELDVILEKFNNHAVIIIDDMRLCGKGPNKRNEICNWEDISPEKIIERVQSRYLKHYFLPSSADPNDRLIIFLDIKKNITSSF